MSNSTLAEYTFDYQAAYVGKSLLIHADCLEWLSQMPENSIHALVTDPPYGIKEYTPDQLEKRENGSGGVWRIPPAFDGSTRSPLPRFTALNRHELEALETFFRHWAQLVTRVLRPGGHLFLASNSYLSQLVFSAIASESLEFRGEIIRLVRTLRGGDRPKNAEQEFPGVCSLPRGNYEPWGLFRKVLPKGMTVSDCLRAYQTGGLRRNPDGNPFSDVIESTRTPKAEKDIASHPSLKPQAFLRQIVYASLPLGEGLVVDPFMGSGATIAAAEAIGYTAAGVEINADYYALSLKAVPNLKTIQTEFDFPVQLSLDLK
jgi:site-specific DNA-methyltransferase (adenine-specific)